MKKRIMENIRDKENSFSFESFEVGTAYFEKDSYGNCLYVEKEGEKVFLFPDRSIQGDHNVSLSGSANLLENKYPVFYALDINEQVTYIKAIDLSSDKIFDVFPPINGNEEEFYYCATDVDDSGEFVMGIKTFDDFPEVLVYDNQKKEIYNFGYKALIDYRVQKVVWLEGNKRFKVYDVEFDQDFELDWDEMIVKKIKS